MISIKQKSRKLSREEISSFISNLDKTSDKEITSWLKAVKENGLDDEETSELTLAMANSGKVLSWEGLEPTIDKHSSGGIGDKTTLLFAPLVAAYGINIPKLSGRALGITGGTIDKLESIKDFRTNLSIQEMREQIKAIGIAIASATSEIAPADKRLYAIRDVTGTTDSIPLIASSIMSKKIAGGSKNIILDVKAGTGAFMKRINDAKELAGTMVSIGKKLNRKIKALVTDMNEPLGYNIGNSLEIKEVLEVLSGKEVSDLTCLVITLAKEAVSLVEGKEKSDLEEKLRRLLFKGQALKKFEELIQYQGGNLDKGFEKAGYIEIVKSTQEGYIQNIDALKIGKAVFELGAGRKSKNDKIDNSVGIVLHKKSGDKVKKGELLAEIHAKNTKDFEKAKSELLNAVKMGEEKSLERKLIYDIYT